MLTGATVVFWLSVSVVLYSYLVYPWLLAALARLFSKPVRENPSFLPTAAVIVPVYNEEKVIKRKIENVLAFDYPAELLTVWVGSDRSNDRTNDIVREFSDSRVHLWEALKRGGKIEVLNNLVPQIDAAILVFTDANTMHNPDILRVVAAMFADPTVGGVAGHIDHAVRAEKEPEEKFYRSFESRQKALESRLHSTISAYGGFYAIRKSLFKPLPFNAYSNDDVLIPMNVIRQKYRMIFQPKALSREEPTESIRMEFSRRIRIGAGNFQAFFWLLDFLNPLQGWPWFCYVSHKVTRWFSPLFILAGVVSCGALSLFSPLILYRILFVVGIAFTVAGLFSLIVPMRFTRYILYFLAMNSALALGFFRFCAGIRSAVWDRTKRR